MGVTGSIACYKAVDLCSKLVQAGAKVDVILTKSALEFVSPLTFRSISHRAVVTELFDAESKLSVEHVALAERAEAVVVAPATANTIAKMALGLADDALSATVLATRAPLVIAPAMDGNMFHNPAVQENLSKLKEPRGCHRGPCRGKAGLRADREGALGGSAGNSGTHSSCPWQEEVTWRDGGL